MNQIVIPTGYMGSGSSAITDLLMEFEGFDAPHGQFEYVFMHCPNGLFDLEDKLLIGNNAIRSDEALHSFRTAMKELYDNPLWWPGRYKHRLSKHFMDYVDCFIGAITLTTSDNFWYHQESRGISAIPRLAAHMACKLLFHGHFMVKKSLLYKGMRLSFPTAHEFYSASRDFLSMIFEDIGINENNLVLDQLLLPFNAWRMKHYFGDNTTCFIVDRDPRDMFLLNKYTWPLQGVQGPYPTDVEKFCVYYARMRESEKPAPNANLKRIHFEDLVYHYEESLAEIMVMLGLSDKDHIQPRKIFNPDSSINNTQLFLCDDYKEEGFYIAHHLQPYLYAFPYEREPQTSARIRF